MKRLLACVTLLFTTAVFAQQSPEAWREWNRPVEPFRIAGNLFYVGASDVTSFLIATPNGHILLDGGMPETAPLIAANIQKLGYELKDVRYIVNSHAHADHAGGIAELQRLTGARVLASARDIPLLARGGLDDPQFGNQYPFPRVYANGIIEDGERVRVGRSELVAHLTPGHTPGCTTWTTTIREQKRDLKVIFLCSMSVPSEYRLIDNPQYPNAISDYQRTFAFLRSQRPDIPLASHGVLFNLTEKIQQLRSGANKSPFIDPEGYDARIKLMETRFEEARKRQESATTK